MRVRGRMGRTRRSERLHRAELNERGRLEILNEKHEKNGRLEENEGPIGGTCRVVYEVSVPSLCGADFGRTKGHNASVSMLMRSTSPSCSTSSEWI